MFFFMFIFASIVFFAGVNYTTDKSIRDKNLCRFSSYRESSYQSVVCLMKSLRKRRSILKPISSKRCSAARMSHFVLQRCSSILACISVSSLIFDYLVEKVSWTFDNFRIIQTLKLCDRNWHEEIPMESHELKNCDEMCVYIEKFIQQNGDSTNAIAFIGL